MKPALAAIDDPYPEIGDFVADKILPLYGKAIVPDLQAKFDIKGRVGMYDGCCSCTGSIPKRPRATRQAGSRQWLQRSKDRRHRVPGLAIAGVDSCGL